MHGHPRARVQVKAQGGRGLHPVQVNHLAAAQGRQVATLAHFVDQMAQHGVACAVRGVVDEQVFCQFAQPVARAVKPGVGRAFQQMGAFELLQHAVQGGFGQVGFVGQVLQRKIAAFAGDHLQQGKQAQGGRVPIDLSGGRCGQGDGGK